MTKILSVALVLVAVATVLFGTSGCTMTLPEQGRSLSVGPAANPNHRETPPPPPMQMQAGSDENRTAAR